MDSLCFGWQWLRSNLLAIVGVAILVALLIAFAAPVLGPAERLEGTITGFPLLGQKSGGARAFVRLADGQTITIRLSGGRCVIGSHVSLLKSRTLFVSNYDIAPTGCDGIGGLKARPLKTSS